MFAKVSASMSFLGAGMKPLLKQLTGGRVVCLTVLGSRVLDAAGHTAPTAMSRSNELMQTLSTPTQSRSVCLENGATHNRAVLLPQFIKCSLNMPPAQHAYIYEFEREQGRFGGRKDGNDRIISKSHKTNK